MPFWDIDDDDVPDVPVPVVAVPRDVPRHSVRRDDVDSLATTVSVTTVVDAAGAGEMDAVVEDHSKNTNKR